ncbi:hypothetical protein F2Q69_00062216 [Brassica cretica]|uniref:Uncharacterized protein n=1 Tax=Brassica cretica TaxID=69181 RepID=A0A8S9RGI7_BRACR|nr:hypothetical protein F2Q69_00062216 [Brassica cretica]
MDTTEKMYNSVIHINDLSTVKDDEVMEENKIKSGKKLIGHFIIGAYLLVDYTCFSSPLDLEIGHEASRRRLLAVTFPTFLFIPATSIEASGGYCSEDKL